METMQWFEQLKQIQNKSISPLNLVLGLSSNLYLTRLIQTGARFELSHNWAAMVMHQIPLTAHALKRICRHRASF